MRLIDADIMRENLEWCKSQSGRYDDIYWDDVIERLDVQPTVDAVPITRCKDCKWYDAELHCKLNGYGCGRSPDWFCADGKKEEEECTSTDTQP